VQQLNFNGIKYDYSEGETGKIELQEQVDYLAELA
jgi:hypothetical protein